MINITEHDIYNRQKTLNLNIPKSVAVIGLGGVGSWTALNFAAVGVRELHLIDHDIIEPHNLNRTPFKLSQINTNKALATAELIYERRYDVMIYTYPKKIEHLTDIEIEDIENVDVVIDCRDTTEPLPKKLNKKLKIIGGYDGYKVTIHINPDLSSIFGEDRVTYTITPSYIVPPQLIASLITLYITSKELHTTKEIVKTFDIRDLFNKFIKV